MGRRRGNGGKSPQRVGSCRICERFLRTGRRYRNPVQVHWDLQQQSRVRHSLERSRNWHPLAAWRRDCVGKGPKSTNTRAVVGLTGFGQFSVFTTTRNRTFATELIMKILIAGGAGYVGSVLIPRLLERGYKVDVVDLFWFGNHLPRQVGTLNKDIFQLTVEDLEPYDQVVFMAGLSNDPMAEFSPAKNFVFNAAAPSYLAYIAKIAGVKRYVYASSCSVYGYTENELFDETRPVSSTYPYGISKLQGEQAALQLIDDNFSVISLRKGTISGYSPRMRLDLIINTMFKNAMKERTITVNNPSIW